MKLPIGVSLATAMLILAMSPEARKIARNLVVKGVAGILNLSEQMKSLSTQVGRQVQSITEEARVDVPMGVNQMTNGNKEEQVDGHV